MLCSRRSLGALGPAHHPRLLVGPAEARRTAFEVVVGPPSAARLLALGVGASQLCATKVGWWFQGNAFGEHHCACAEIAAHRPAQC